MLNYICVVFCLFFVGCAALNGQLSGELVPQENASNECILHANENFAVTAYTNGNVLLETDQLPDNAVNGMNSAQ